VRPTRLRVAPRNYERVIKTPPSKGIQIGGASVYYQAAYFPPSARDTFHTVRPIRVSSNTAVSTHTVPREFPPNAICETVCARKTRGEHSWARVGQKKSQVKYFRRFRSRGIPVCDDGAGTRRMGRGGDGIVLRVRIAIKRALVYMGVYTCAFSPLLFRRTRKRARPRTTTNGSEFLI